MNEARALENNPSTEGITGGETGGYYVGSGRPAENQTKNKKGILKKGGPIGLIIAAILIVGAMFMGGQSFQAFSLVNNIMSNYGSSSYSTTVRLANTLYKAVSKTGKKVKLTPELEEAGGSADLKFNTDADSNIESISIKSTGETFDAGNIESGMNGKLGNNVSKAGQNVDIQSTYNSKTKTSAANRIGWEKSRYNEVDSGAPNAKAKFDEAAEGKTRTTSFEGLDVREEEDGETGDIKNKADMDPEASGKIQNGKIDADGVDLNTKLTNVAGTAASAAGGVSSAACIYSGVATALTALVISQLSQSMINAGSGYSEATQKVQVGDGDGTSLHEYQNRTNSGDFWQSISVRSLFGGNTGDSSTGISNLENVVKSGALIVGSGIAAWRTCIGFRRVAAGLGVASDILAVVTGGIAAAIKAIGKAAVKAAAIALVGAGVISAVVSIASDMLAVDPVSDMSTKEAADQVVGGGNKILRFMHQSQGGSLGTSAKLAEFNQYKQDIIARRAEYDRDNLSPFDTSSQYTFLGSLKYSLVQFSVLNSNNSVLSFIKSSGAILSNSLTSLMPTSSAFEYNSIVNEDGDCPYINSIGAAGDALICNGVTISDPDSFNIAYEDAVKYLQEHGQLTYDDPPKVVANSELAKYISFWTVRDSHPGLADSNITNKLVVQSNTGNTGADAVIDGVIGAIPFVGDSIDLANATIEENNYEYIFGAKYVAGGEYWNGNDGGEMMRNIQAFLELDTLYSDLALIETSTLATYLDEYYAENPLDESYEGKLARFSGLSKDQVIAALDYIDYLYEIATYNPADRYKFFEEEPEQVISLDNNTEYVIAVDKPSLAADRIQVVYADTRSLYTTSA